MVLGTDMTGIAVRSISWDDVWPFFLGMCLVSISIVVLAGWNACLYPIHAGAKGFDQDVTWLEQTSWSFVPAVFVGAIGGVIAEVVLVAFRTLRGPPTDLGRD